MSWVTATINEWAVSFALGWHPRTFLSPMPESHILELYQHSSERVQYSFREYNRLRRYEGEIFAYRGVTVVYTLVTVGVLAVTGILTYEIFFAVE